MRAAVVVNGAAATTIALLGSLVATPSAQAADFGIALNGTYRAVSNGDWAQSSEGPYGAGGARVYRDQPSKVETWTVNSDCVSPLECYGTVRSDAGWTGALEFNGDEWFVDRDIPNWEPCPDGTAAPGHQTFGMWGFDPSTSLRSSKFRDLIVGFEKTLGPSGACGVNKPLYIELPVRLDRLS
jgi:hypothetical protein